MTFLANPHFILQISLAKTLKKLNIIIWAPGILHLKGLGMRNLQYEMRICQKSHNKVTKTVYVWFEFL